jgi:hypothetical protein
VTITDRIRRDIGTAHTLAAVIAAKLTPALAHLSNELDALDGYPATASGADTGPRGTGPTNTATDPHDDTDPGPIPVPVTAVESIVFRRLQDANHARHRGATTNLETIADLAHTYRHITRLLLVELENNAGTVTAADLEALRCKGWGGKLKCPDAAFADARRTDNRCLNCGPAEDTRKMREEQLRRDRRRDRRGNDEAVA